MTVLDAIRSVVAQADAVEPVRPDVARELRSAADVILESIPPLAVADAALLLRQSAPTVRDWIDDGLLEAERVGRMRRVSPRSLLVVLPAVEAWEANGRRGRLKKLLKEQLAEADAGSPVDLDQVILPGAVGVVPVGVLQGIVDRRGPTAEPVAAGWLASVRRRPSNRRRARAPEARRSTTSGR
ncbi:MAG TPA: helix-turn-helix domain-containing protein [Chloroflexota bacterium]|jgi:excisionase family DNA binding protein